MDKACRKESQGSREKEGVRDGVREGVGGEPAQCLEFLNGLTGRLQTEAGLFTKPSHELRFTIGAKQRCICNLYLCTYSFIQLKNRM